MNIASFLALIISVISLLIVLWDRFPRVYVKIESEEIYQDGIDGNSEVKVGEGLQITITNKSKAKILITGVYIEWSKYILRPVYDHRTSLYDHDIEPLAHYNDSEPFERFWIEPWGNNVELGAEIEEFEYQLRRQISSTWHKISYRVVVSDGLNNQYRSNRIILHASPVRNGD